MTDEALRAALSRIVEGATAQRRRSGTIVSTRGRHVDVVLDGEGVGLVSAYRGVFEPVVGARVAVERVANTQEWRVVGVADDSLSARGDLPYDLERQGQSLYYPLALEAVNDGAYNLAASGLELTLYNIHYTERDGTFHYIASATLDLADSVPSSDKRWAVVRVDVDAETLSVYEHPTGTAPLSEWPAAANAARAGGHIPLLAVRLDAGMTEWPAAWKSLARGYSYTNKRIIRVPYPTEAVEPPDPTGVDEFILLTDAPASYSGAAGKYVAVNGAADGLEFIAPYTFSAAGDTGTTQIIGAGNTLTIAGGVGLSSAASATDTVTLDLDVPVSVTHGGTGADMSGTGGGAVMQASTGAAFSVLKHNFTAVANPTHDDDVTLGYGVGSIWINTSTGHIYMATSVADGAADWKTVHGGGGGGGGTDFDLAADTGTPETVGTGETVTIAGGAGIATAVSATNTVTVSIDTTGASNGDVLQIVSGAPTFVPASGVGAAIVADDDDLVTVDPASTVRFPAGTLEDVGGGVARYHPRGRGTATEWNAAAVGSLVRWYKGSAGVTATLHRVSSWADQSGAGATLSQGTAISQPTRCKAALNGWDGLYFDGVDDFMTSSGAPVTGAGARTLIMVVAWGASTNDIPNTRPMCHWGTTSNFQAYGMSVRTRTNNGAGGVHGTFGMDYYGQDMDAATPPAELQPAILISQYDGTTDRMYYNGALVMENTVTLNTGTASGFQIGRGLFGTPTEACFIVCEVAIFSKALSLSERNGVFDALSVKYNIPLSS